MNSLRFPTRRRQSGFGLLEALVALVLLSSIGFTLLAWIEQNLNTMQRMRSFYSEQEARRTVTEWIYTLNPMETPSGELVIGALRLSWKAEPQAEKVSQMGYPSGVGLHDMALYDVAVSVFREREVTPWFVEKVVCVGYRKVRELGNPFKN